MKDNTLVLKNSSGEKQEYRILLDIEDTTNNVNYVIYTDDMIHHLVFLIPFPSSS